MKTINSVEILGFAGRDAEKRSDKAPVKFSVATGNDTTPGGGKNPLCFHNVTVWDRQSEALKIRKGDYVRLAGRLNYTEWTGQDGAKRCGVEIVADRVEIPKDSPPQSQPKPVTAHVEAKTVPHSSDRTISPQAAARGTKPILNAHGVDVDDRDIPF